MKTNKNPAYLLILAIISFGIATVVGFIYFDNAPEHILLRIMLTVQNSISAFAFSPSVKVVDVLEGMSAESTMFEWGLLYAYAIALFLAQICTATIIIAAFKTLVVKAAETVSGIGRKKDYIMVFGYNEKVQILLDNICKKPEAAQEENKKEADKKNRKSQKPQKVIYLVTDTSFDQEKQLEFARKQVVWIDADVLSLSGKKAEKLKKKIDDSEAVILFEESEMRNLSIYSKLCEDETLKSPDANCYLHCEDDGIREVIEQYYTNSTRGSKIPDLLIFSSAEIKVNKIFKDIEVLGWMPRALTEAALAENTSAKPIYVNNASDFDIHLLIVGFGKTGQQMLLQTLNQGVLHSRSRIWIDVVDRKALEIDDLFMKRFHNNYMRKSETKIRLEDSSLVSCATYTIDEDGCDGELQIRFFETEIRGRKFQMTLDEIVKTKEDDFPLTNIMVGFHELDTLASCIMDVEKHAAKVMQKKNIKMVVCGDISDNLLKYLKAHNLVGDIQKNVEIVDTISNKDEICLENIFDTDREKLAKSYYYIYNKIFMAINHVEYELNWKELSYEDKMSNYALSYHQKVKEKIISTFWKEEMEDKEFYFGADGKLLRYENDSYIHQTDIFLKNLENDSFIEELIRLEHRRWNYFKASHGWQYEKDSTKELTKEEQEKEKQRKKSEKKHSCLCSYETLRKEEKAKIVYDLIPLLYREEKDKNMQSN